MRKYRDRLVFSVKILRFCNATAKHPGYEFLGGKLVPLIDN